MEHQFGRFFSEVPDQIDEPLTITWSRLGCCDRG